MLARANHDRPGRIIADGHWTLAWMIINSCFGAIECPPIDRILEQMPLFRFNLEARDFATDLVDRSCIEAAQARAVADGIARKLRKIHPDMIDPDCVIVVRNERGRVIYRAQLLKEFLATPLN